MYNALLIDQSLALNRRRDDQADVKTEDLAEIEKEKGDEYYETISVHTDGSALPKSNIKSSDHITRIYACATMWHETKDEMIEFLKSIMRLDEDQCARRVAQKYLRIVDPDYYEFESELRLRRCNQHSRLNLNFYFQLTFSSMMPSKSLTTVTTTFKLIDSLSFW